MITFENLWKMLENKKISQYKLIHDYGISKGQLDRLKKNSNVTINTIDVLCNILDCEVGEILTHIKDSNNKFTP